MRKVQGFALSTKQSVAPFRNLKYKTHLELLIIFFYYIPHLLWIMELKQQLQNALTKVDIFQLLHFKPYLQEYHDQNQSSEQAGSL